MWHVLEEEKGACTNSEEIPEEKRSLGRHRCRWEDNIKIDLQEVEWLRKGTGDGH